MLAVTSNRALKGQIRLPKHDRVEVLKGCFGNQLTSWCFVDYWVIIVTGKFTVVLQSQMWLGATWSSTCFPFLNHCNGVTLTRSASHSLWFHQTILSAKERMWMLHPSFFLNCWWGYDVRFFVCFLLVNKLIQRRIHIYFSCRNILQSLKRKSVNVVKQWH